MAGKNKDNEFVQCIRCRNGKFMQWLENPIIAYCEHFNERQVAEARRICRSFTESGIENPEIEHFDHYDRN
jgi:hypothetical protein